MTGSLTKPLEDPNALFRFHEDEKEGPLLNCRSIWFQNAREPLLVVSELLYTMLNLRLAFTQRGHDLKDSEVQGVWALGGGVACVKISTSESQNLDT